MAQRNLRRALTAVVLTAVLATASAAAAGTPAPPARSLVEQVWQWMGSTLERLFQGQRTPFPDEAPDGRLPHECPVCGDKGGGIDPNG